MQVSIGINKGWLRLRWQHQGKNYSLYPGVQDSPTGRAQAKLKAAQIEGDIHSGNFDLTLLKYKPQTLGKAATDLTCPELFRKFTQAMEREKALSVGALCKYRGVQAHLDKQLKVSAKGVGDRAAGDFAAYLVEKVSNTTAKQYLWLLKACWDWADGKYLTDSNPWAAQVTRIKPTPKQKTKPFNTAEIRAILAGFKEDRYYSPYYHLVAFILGVGCRFGEAAGLQWQHVSQDFSSVWIGESVTREGKRKSTKNGKERTVLLSPGIAAMLRELHQTRQPTQTDLVFPAPRGGLMNDHLFNRRAWKSVLAKVNVPYRKPYGMRHTAISHALANGAHHLQVAQQTGHDPRVLYQSYASVIENQSVFVEF
jgi:integrase